MSWNNRDEGFLEGESSSDLKVPVNIRGKGEEEILCNMSAKHFLLNPLPPSFLHRPSVINKNLTPHTLTSLACYSTLP